jgi:hypothetical protein
MGLAFGGPDEKLHVLTLPILTAWAQRASAPYAFHPSRWNVCWSRMITRSAVSVQ